MSFVWSKRVADGFRRRWRRQPPSEAEILAEVRQGLADVSHPYSIDVQIESRRVTLSGPILAREVVGLLRHVARIPGVLRVDNRLRVRRATERFRD